MRSRKRQGGWWQVAAAAVSAYGALTANKQSQQYGVDMSGTAHQREVRDLRAAGLNPILSGTGGAGASTPQAQFSNVGDAAVNSAMAARANEAQVALTRQQKKTEENRTEDEWNKSKISDFERRVLDARQHNYKESGIDLEARRRNAESSAAGTAAALEQKIDQDSGDWMRTLKRLGLDAGSAAQILRLFKPGK